MSDLLDRGADAFLTTAFDERLQNFNGFIRHSLWATEPLWQVVQYSLSVPGATAIPTGRTYMTTTRYQPARAGPLGNFRFNFFGTALEYRTKELAAAPLSSEEFGIHISSEIPALKFLIKEVTLGSQSNAK